VEEAVGEMVDAVVEGGRVHPLRADVLMTTKMAAVVL
jgi:hypothetical protein